jgi:Resolvase, N terminal domain
MQALAVTGYQRLGVGGRPTRASAYTERSRLATWTDRRGWRLASILQEQSSSRRALRDAVARVTSRDSDGIVVPSLAHLGGSLLDASLVIERILAAGGVFASIDERLDLSTVSGRRRYLCLCDLSSCPGRREGRAWSEPAASPDSARADSHVWWRAGLGALARDRGDELGAGFDGAVPVGLGEV